MRVLIFIFFMFSVSVSANQNVESLKLGAGDVIDVFVAGNPDLSSQLQVALDGSVNMPLIGKVDLVNKTSTQAELYIEKALKSGGFLRKPDVKVSLVKSVRNEVTILGVVPNPGKYPIGASNENIIDLLALAGGVGSMNQVILLRKTDSFLKRYEFNIEELLLHSGADEFESDGMQLIQGDIVYVKKAPVYYTYGEVSAIAAFELEKNLTLMQALARAGGLTKIADEDDIQVKRIIDGKYKLISVNFDDIILEDDIIVVDESLF